MSFIWWMLAVAVAIVWVISLFDIFRRHLGGGRTAAWVLLILILPLVGSLIYVLQRKPEPGDAQRTADAERARRDEARRRPFDSTGF